MLLEKEVWVVATKERPTVFLMEDGNQTELLEQAEHFSQRENAEAELHGLDNECEFMVLGLKITIENL